MKILSIETSCDETAVAILECNGDPKEDTLSFKVLGNALHSQISSHKQFGGVVPMLAKREHAKKLIPLFKQVLAEAFPRALTTFSAFPNTRPDSLPVKEKALLEKLSEIFGREEEFLSDFLAMIPLVAKPDIDAIAVTEGPGLEPALWMGIIFAKALSETYGIPLIPVNHMEGHILSVLPQKIIFPALALLISGGHTELVLMRGWNQYEVIGQTRDDAVGEAFDKVARMLGLPYPGGPQISHLAKFQRKTQTSTPEYVLPRPMIHSKDYDFSFSGIKTAVLYSLRKMQDGADLAQEVVAKEFEDAVTEVLISKTYRAVDEYNIKTLIIGGGVISNEYIRAQFTEKAATYIELKLLLPEKDLRTDNALMIGLAGYVKGLNKGQPEDLKAKGNLKLTV
jgi:N6-L-threonylcarbamoyladenine synthase